MRASTLPRKRAAGRLEAIYPYLLLALAQLSWAGNWVIGRAVRASLPPIGLTFWRWTVAALVLAPFALPLLKDKGAILKREWRLIAILGITGAGFFQAMVYTGLSLTEATNATLMNSAAPLFIMLIAWIMAVERVNARQLAGIAVSFCGILTIVAHGNFAELAHLHVDPGDVVIFFAMPAWGLYCVLLRRRPKELDAVTFLFLIAVTGALALFPFYVAESVFWRRPELSWRTVAVLAYVGPFASVFSYLLWNRGLEIVGPNRASFTIHLLPAFAALLATIFLGEHLQLYHMIGIATILAGVTLATTARAPVTAR